MTTPESAGKGTRTFRVNDTLPHLVFNYPTCSHCGRDVTIEDGDHAWCETCLVQWDRIEDGHVATPDDGREGTDVPCEMFPNGTFNPVEHVGKDGIHYKPGPPLPCILPSGHEGEHINPWDCTATYPLTPGGTS